MITNTTQGSQAIYSKFTPFSTSIIIRNKESIIIRNKEPRKNTPCHSEHVYIFFFNDHTLGGQYCEICTVHAVEFSQVIPDWLYLK